MANDVLVVAEKFTKYPAGRYRSDGKYSGERFRDDVLIPALQSSDKLTIDLNGTMGFGSSFLEEAFGGLVRCAGLNQSDLKAKMSFVSKDPSLVDEIWDYIEAADS